MKKLLLFFTLLACVANNLWAQSVNDNMDAYLAEISRKARLFCKYVVAVGTSPGQNGAVSEKEKNDIINNRVKGLFWNYSARKMIVTNGKTGELIRDLKMSAYFNNLKAQAKSRVNETRTYELRYMGIKPSGKGINNKSFVLKRTLPDGSKLYASNIIIDQIYHVIKWTPEGPVVKEEHDVKVMEVNVLEKPSGKTSIYLGDVTQAYRI